MSSMISVFTGACRVAVSSVDVSKMLDWRPVSFGARTIRSLLSSLKYDMSSPASATSQQAARPGQHVLSLCGAARHGCPL